MFTCISEQLVRVSTHEKIKDAFLRTKEIGPVLAEQAAN